MSHCLSTDRDSNTIPMPGAPAASSRGDAGQANSRAAQDSTARRQAPNDHHFQRTLCCARSFRASLYNNTNMLCEFKSALRCIGSAQPCCHARAGGGTYEREREPAQYNEPATNKEVAIVPWPTNIPQVPRSLCATHVVVSHDKAACCVRRAS